jgi:hypothetical protein
MWAPFLNAPSRERVRPSAAWRWPARTSTLRPGRLRTPPWSCWPSPCAVGVCFALVWILTTPLRNVGWVFLSDVYRVLSLNDSLGNECLHQYQGVLRNAEVRQLEGLTYVYAVWGALFAVPMEVLSVNEEQYGDCCATGGSLRTQLSMSISPTCVWIRCSRWRRKPE